MPGSAMKLAAKRRACSASARRSSSRRVVMPNSCSSPGEVDPARHRRPQPQPGKGPAQRARSTSTISSMPGRSTLITTGRPSGSCASCTWAKEAAPSGFSMKVAKILSSGRRNSFSTAARMAANGAAGTSSWRPRSSRTTAIGKMSTRVERYWPSLIHTPPQVTARQRGSAGRGAASGRPARGAGSAGSGAVARAGRRRRTSPKRGRKRAASASSASAGAGWRLARGSRARSWGLGELLQVGALVAGE